MSALRGSRPAVRGLASRRREARAASRELEWGRLPAAPAGQPSAGRVEAGFRSLRGARLARVTDLIRDRRLPFDHDVGAEAFVRLIAEAFHLHDVGGLLERTV